MSERQAGDDVSATDKARREHPAIVLRDDCRPDELCISCRREMGDYHDVLCYVFANNRVLIRNEAGEGGAAQRPNAALTRIALSRDHDPDE